MEEGMSRSNMIHFPGFRFHPTEEELLDFYLRSKIQGRELQLEIIPTINLYRYDPWELPGMARIGEREWYFYVPRDRRKQGNGGRPSRTTERGFWKATGCDRPVRSAADPKRLIGLKKTLVYYVGRAPRGSKTEWVMNEYRLPDPPSGDAPIKEDMVLCKIHRKAASMKELEQQAAAMMAAGLEEEEQATASTWNSGSSTTESVDGWCQQESFLVEEKQEEITSAGDVSRKTTVASRRPTLPELEVPMHDALEWLQDPFLTQLRSPWLADLIWSPPYSTILHFECS